MLKLGLCVITCLDYRVGPATFLGMELGDVVLVRKVSGRVTDELMLLGVSGFRARSANWPVNATSQIHRTGNPAPEPTHHREVARHRPVLARRAQQHPKAAQKWWTASTTSAIVDSVHQLVLQEEPS